MGHLEVPFPQPREKTQRPTQPPLEFSQCQCCIKHAIKQKSLKIKIRTTLTKSIKEVLSVRCTINVMLLNTQSTSAGEEGGFDSGQKVTISDGGRQRWHHSALSCSVIWNIWNKSSLTATGHRDTCCTTHHQSRKICRKDSEVKSFFFLGSALHKYI